MFTGAGERKCGGNWEDPRSVADTAGLRQAVLVQMHFGFSEISCFEAQQSGGGGTAHSTD